MFDLSQSPADPTAARGYGELYRLWKSNQDAFDQGQNIAPASFDEWTRQVTNHLDPREARFFSEPFGADAPQHSQTRQVRTVVRLHKILMDRHGVKLPKEGGGLG